jgi:MoaA/NifB/PqqE/SkfB family radical SAM enzyme
LDTRECLDVVDQLAHLGCELITLSGGEPTARPDWDQVARAAVARGIHVNMVSNGVLGSAGRRTEVVRRAKEAGLCNVGISVEGPRDVHDQVRGPGTYDQALATVGELARGGVSATILTTVNRLNHRLLREVASVVATSGASAWRLQLGKPMGNLADHDDWVLEPRDIRDLLPLLARIKQEVDFHVAVGDSLGYYGPHDAVLRGRGWRNRAESWHGCQAGMQAIGIESDGGVKACLSLQAKWGDTDPFREGDLRQESLDAIWHRPGIFGFNRDFDPSSLTGGCATCGHARRCRGGARCVAAAFTGALTEDPFCYQRVAPREARGFSSVGQSVAAAATALVLQVGAPGCTPSGKSDAGTTVEDARPATGLDAGKRPDASGLDAARTDTLDCSNVCCECDYGTPPPAGCCPVSQPDASVPDAAAATDAARTDTLDCSNVCCECEYGIPPPGCCTAPQPDASVTDAARTDTLDCAGVCCTCDYGTSPPPGCCDP